MNKWNQQLIRSLGFWVVMMCFFSCSPKADNIQELPQPAFNAIPAELPAPLKAKYLDSDSLLPPTVIPLKKRPKTVPTHTNVHAAGTPTVVQVPENLRIITLGENGVPFPLTVPVIKRIVPATHPKPVPALEPVYTDDAVYNINYLSDKQGLQIGVNTVLEDKRGYLWFGGTGGLVRYDGKNFFHYTKEDGFLDQVKSLIEDSKGNIWIAGIGGICSYDGKMVTHYNSESETDKNNGLKLSGCLAVIEDSKGNIWFSNRGSGKEESGVYCFNGTNFTVFEKKHWLSKKDEKREQRSSENQVVTILEDSRGNFWWGTAGSGVLRYDGQHIIQYTMQDGLIDNFLWSIEEDSKGQIWFGSGLGIDLVETKEKGVGYYTPDLMTPLEMGGTFTNFTQKEGFSNNVISGITEDKFNNLWFSTYVGEIIKYDGINFTYLKAAENLKASNTSITEDSKGNFWVGNSVGEDGKIYRFQPNSFAHFLGEQGLGSLFIFGLKEDSKGNLWMGTWGSGVMKYDGQNITIFNKEHGLCDNYITNIEEDSKGRIWFGSLYNGVSCFDGKVFTNYSNGQGFAVGTVFNLKEDHLGHLWFTCGGGGEDWIVRLNQNTGQFTHFFNDPADNINGIGGTITEDSQHNLWFGGKGWTAKYDPGKDQIKYMYQFDPDKNTRVTYMLEDRKGNFWFGSSNRLLKVDNTAEGDANKFTVFKKGIGFPEFDIKSIVQDNQKNIWIGSDRGLELLVGGLENISERKWVSYRNADGLKSKHYTNGKLLDSKNHMWWGTGTAGLTTLDLNTFVIPTESPKSLNLSHIEINQEFIDFGNLSDTASSTLAFAQAVNKGVDSVVPFYNYPNHLKLPYDLNHLTFHFSAIDWGAPHQIRYSYKMQGLDDDWSKLQTKAEADYRNLPYGTFTFKVKAIGEAHVWSEPFTYTFVIRPPWWHSWWAYVLYALLAVVAVGGYVVRLRRKIKEKQKQLEWEQELNRELRELNIATTRFVPKDFVQILNKDTLIELKLGDQIKATMTVLFADIRDYTSLSEKMTPEENFKFINAYLGRMGPIIQEHGGFICQYYGDGIMALFKDNHDMAVKAAIEMQQALQRYNRKRFARNRQPIQIGIGLNTGQLMLGVIGDEQRYDTSVISDAVNTAARMEGLTKIFGCQVIVSEKTLMELNISTEMEGVDTLGGDYRFLGKVRVKGKEKVVKIYDFYDGQTDDIRQLKSKTKAQFEKALQFYYEQEFGKSADLFKVILEEYPGDIATKYYMDKSVGYIIGSVEENWNGVEDMMSK